MRHHGRWGSEGICRLDGYSGRHCFNGRGCCAQVSGRDSLWLPVPVVTIVWVPASFHIPPTSTHSPPTTSPVTTSFNPTSFNPALVRALHFHSNLPNSHSLAFHLADPSLELLHPRYHNIDGVVEINGFNYTNINHVTCVPVSPAIHSTFTNLTMHVHHATSCTFLSHTRPCYHYLLSTLFPSILCYPYSVLE